MSEEHAAVRAALGVVGAWTFAFDSRSVAQIGEDARELESLGYTALWVPEGSSSRDVFAHLSVLASATSAITVCSGIANITARAADVMAGGARTLTDAFGGRIVVGIGVGHSYSTEGRGLDWDRPLARMREYLDRMDEARGRRLSLEGSGVCSRHLVTACSAYRPHAHSVRTPTSFRSSTPRGHARC
jgi:alkanesulfonate monooxygenase SsuD/methylene tetrahydromethanopterin reductase-like flavin-dependent oxidoreductase (luciferase family)